MTKYVILDKKKINKEDDQWGFIEFISKSSRDWI